MALQFAIDPENGETFQDAEQKRKDARMMIASALARTPRNVGEGLNAIGQALIARQMQKEAAAAEKTNAATSSSLLQDLLGIAPFPAAPGSSGTVAPAASPMATDAPTQRVEQAFAASAPSTAPADTGWLQYDNANAIRDQPLDPKLTSALGFLPDMGVSMKVFSGGQPSTGPDRTGSHRHDHGDAADVFFYKDGRQLNWNNPQDVPIFQQIVERARGNGVTGFGAGEGYMRPGSMHIGFGTPAVWGAGGHGANAPDWLRTAFNTPYEAPPAVAATNAMAGNSPAVPPLPAPVNVPDMPVAGQPQPVQVAQNATPGQMSDAQALKLLGAEPYNPQQAARAAIAKAMSNPSVSPTVQRIAAIMLGRQMKQQDPSAQLDMRYKQAQLDNLLHPPIKPTDDQRELTEINKERQTAGLPPLRLDEWLTNKGKAGATIINNNPEGAMFAGMPPDVRKEMFARRTEAQDSADLINVTNQGLQLLDQGAITGAGSGAKIAAIKWAQTLGVDVPGDIVSAANNTETYRSIMAKAVGKVIKNFGSGTGLSDTDRQYAERLAGGDTTLNEPAIRRILAAGAKQARQKIEGFTAMRDKVMKGDLGAMLNVNEPPAYTPPANATSGQPVRIEREQDYLALPRGAQYVAPDGTVRRKP